MAEILSAEVKRAALLAYLDEIKASPFQFGTMDCVTMAAAWVKRLHNVDAAPLLPEYTTAEQGLADVKRRGGFDLYAIKVMAHLGFASTAEPEDGDLGLLVRVRHVKQVGGGLLALKFKDLWISKIDRGLFGERTSPMIAWRL